MGWKCHELGGLFSSMAETEHPSKMAGAVVSQIANLDFLKVIMHGPFIVFGNLDGFMENQ